jgi:hypothetical protein
MWGIRTHFLGSFGESTVGLNVMPRPWINFRPEIRGDFAPAPVLGPIDATIPREEAQGDNCLPLTVGLFRQLAFSF